MVSILRQYWPRPGGALGIKRTVLAAVAVALVLGQAAPASAQVTSETALSAPVAAGITLKVVHGYNDPLPGERCAIGTASDHCGNQKYGLDLAPQNTSDRRILAPLPGKIGWKSGDCLGITTKDNYNLNVCHFGSYKVNQGDTVVRGQHLGDRSTTWIHLSLDDRYRQSSKPPVPFNGAHTLEGKALNPQADSARNQYNNTTIVSTNGGSTTPPPPTTSCSVGQFRAEYFNNRTLSGNPVLVRCESSINNDWGGGGPGGGVPTDNFSVRWTGRHTFDGATYTFIARADDGVRLSVDGTRIVDAWKDQGPTEYRASRSLGAGQHEVKVEFYENGGGAVAQVRWEKGSAPTPNPGPAPKPAPTRSEVVVDDRAGGFSKGGQYWWEAGIGYSSHMWWTYVNGNSVSSWGEWRANLAGGTYEVYVFVPRDNATTRNARYEIYHQGGTATRAVNQNAYYDAWVSLGTYSFGAGDGRRVRLTDATGEAGNSRLKVGFDAMRFTPR